MFNKSSKIFIAGSTGMVGSNLYYKLKSLKYKKIMRPNSKDLDLRNKKEVNRWFKDHKPEYVFLTAAKVGGIKANSEFPVDFLLNNLEIQNNVITSAKNFRVKKLLFLGSSCIYPKFSKQPIKEDSLLSGSLEKTNEAYAIAKIAGIKLCEAYRDQYGCNFISAMPTNLYGENDNFNIENGHVLPSLISKFHYAKFNKKKEVVLWGTGKPKREFLYVKDLCEALIFLMKKYDGKSQINIGSGNEISIKELAKKISKLTKYSGKILYDKSYPDGTPRKLLNSNKINKLGWFAKTSLDSGLRKVYKFYINKKN